MGRKKLLMVVGGGHGKVGIGVESILCGWRSWKSSDLASSWGTCRQQKFEVVGLIPVHCSISEGGAPSGLRGWLTTTGMEIVPSDEEFRGTTEGLYGAVIHDYEGNEGFFTVHASESANMNISLP